MTLFPVSGDTAWNEVFSMSLALQILAGLAVCGLFLWMMVTSQNSSTGRIMSLDDLIEPENAYQIGYLIGLTGGTILDVSVVRHALQRFEQTQGYQPTLRDAALIVGLMRNP